MRRLSNGGGIHTVTLARASHLARATLYYEHRPGPHRRLHADEPRARGPIHRVAVAHASFGRRRVWSALRCKKGKFIMRRRVRRMLKEEGLPKKGHFSRLRLPETGHLAAPEPNQRRCACLTYVGTTEFGPVPLMVVVDTCTREILGHELLRSCGTRESLSEMDRAVLKPFPNTGSAPGSNLRIHGNAQFVAHRLQDCCRTMGILWTALRTRRPGGNGMTRSSNGHFKQDYLWTLERTSFLETRQVAECGVGDCNMQRHHSSLDYLT